MRYVALSAFSLALALSTTPLSLAHAVEPSTTAKPFPDAKRVDLLLQSYFSKLTDRQQLDLISADDLQGLYRELEQIGWTVRDQREINQRLLKDSDWLVSKLRTRQGTKFMRKIADFPGGYARLDLMRQSKQGQKEVSGIITTPGGEELIEFLSTNKVGQNTSRLLAAEHPKQSKLIEERLYTQAEILNQFRLSYEAESARRAKAAAVIQSSLPDQVSKDPQSPPTDDPGASAE